MRAPRRHAFTLVELLVVISIIALLVALLLPTLASARKAARIILCGSQLRQHGVGMNAYQVDSQGHYPLFGGAVGDVGYGRIGSPGSSGTRGWSTIDFDPAYYNTFGSYIGLTNDNAGNTPRSSLAPIKYCPVVDWFNYGPNTFANVGFTTWTSGLPGYSYYTGRKMFVPPGGSGYFEFDTVERRENTRELLMTDIIMQATEPYFSWGYTTLDPAVPWFNPHVDRSCTISPSGSFNELAADGHVANLRFTATTQLTTDYPHIYFEGQVVGPVSSLGDGPYAITP